MHFYRTEGAGRIYTICFKFFSFLNANWILLSQIVTFNLVRMCWRTSYKFGSNKWRRIVLISDVKSGPRLDKDELVSPLSSQFLIFTRHLVLQFSSILVMWVSHKFSITDINMYSTSSSEQINKLHIYVLDTLTYLYLQTYEKSFHFTEI